MNFLKNSFLAVLLVATTAFADQTLELRDDVEVDSTGVFLDQVIVANTNLVLPQVLLAASPAFCQTVIFSRAQIVEFARKNFSELNTTNWSGAAQLRIHRRSRSLPQTELVEMLTAAIQKDFVKEKGELELNLSRAWNAVLVPDEPIILRITELPAIGVSANFITRFEILNGKESVGNWQVSAQAKVWKEIPIAHSTLLRGQLVRNADATLERRDLLLVRDAFVNFPTSDESLELTENISPGMPILNRSVKARPVIRRGRVVDGLYQDGGLNITLKVETLEDGLLGQTVRVRNPKTKRELYGKVQNEQTILISL